MHLIRISPKTARFSSRLRREDGASMVEFAISFGIFAAVTFGILILCMALFCYEYVDYASREAARWAIVRGNECTASSSMPGCPADMTDIQNYVKGLNYPIVVPSQLKITATWWKAQSGTYTDSAGNPVSYTYWTSCGDDPSGCNNHGDQVQVTVSYPFSMGIPFVGSFSPDVSSSSRMVISQ